MLVPLSELKATALLLHVAVTPAGNPLTARLTVPVYVPLPTIVITFVADWPWRKDSELDAGVTDSVGGVSVTDSETVAVDVTVVEAADATWELRVSVALPAAAVELPVNVSVQTTAPALVTVGALHDAVNPFGNPDATLIEDPAAPLATVNPPNGVPVTVTVAVPSDNIDTDPGATASLIAGACCT